MCSFFLTRDSRAKKAPRCFFLGGWEYLWFGRVSEVFFIFPEIGGGSDANIFFHQRVERIFSCCYELPIQLLHLEVGKRPKPNIEGCSVPSSTKVYCFWWNSHQLLTFFKNSTQKSRPRKKKTHMLLEPDFSRLFYYSGSISHGMIPKTFEPWFQKPLSGPISIQSVIYANIPDSLWQPSSVWNVRHEEKSRDEFWNGVWTNFTP